MSVTIQANTKLTQIKKFGNLDPRTKIILLCVVNMTVFQGGALPVMLPFVFLPFLLLFVSRLFKAATLYALLMIMGALSHMFIDLGGVTGTLQTVILMFAGMFNRMLPGFIMGYYIVSTTGVSEFIAAMEKMRVPHGIVIPFAVMLRFFPTIVEESRSIGDAMSMRGVAFGSSRFFKDPFSIVEYRLIPLLMSVVKIGEELSAASLTRGLGGPRKRTSVCRIGFSLFDYALVIFVFASFVVFIHYQISSRYFN